MKIVFAVAGKRFFLLLNEKLTNPIEVVIRLNWYSELVSIDVCMH